MNTVRWSVERSVFAFGGSFVVICSLLALIIHPDFTYGTLFVGSMFVVFALTGYCPAAIFFDRLLNRSR